MTVRQLPVFRWPVDVVIVHGLPPAIWATRASRRKLWKCRWIDTPESSWAAVSGGCVGTAVRFSGYIGLQLVAAVPFCRSQWISLTEGLFPSPTSARTPRLITSLILACCGVTHKNYLNNRISKYQIIPGSSPALTGGSLPPSPLRIKGSGSERPPPIIFARIDRPMNALQHWHYWFSHTKKLCIRLSSTEVHF